MSPLLKTNKPKKLIYHTLKRFLQQYCTDFFAQILKTSSWWEFFKILKDHGPKRPPSGCNLGGLFPSPSWNFFETNHSVNLNSSPWPSVLNQSPQWDLYLLFKNKTNLNNKSSLGGSSGDHWTDSLPRRDFYSNITLTFFGSNSKDNILSFKMIWPSFLNQSPQRHLYLLF